MPGMALAAEAVQQMRENCKRDLPWFVGMNGDNKSVIVPVLGGPSLKRRIESVRSRKRHGETICACNGAAKFLRSHHIMPDIVAFVDPGPAVLGFIPETAGTSIYLVASICHPSVFDKLKELGANVVVWHPDIGEKEQVEITDAYPQKPVVFLGGGNTIGLRMLNVGYALGFRRFHFYGLDGSIAEDGSDHAYIKHDGPETGDIVLAKFKNKTYRTHKWMVQQAGMFLEDYFPQFARLGCEIFVHGEGLIPDMCKELRSLV